METSIVLQTIFFISASNFMGHFLLLQTIFFRIFHPLPPLKKDNGVFLGTLLNWVSSCDWILFFIFLKLCKNVPFPSIPIGITQTSITQRTADNFWWEISWLIASSWKCVNFITWFLIKQRVEEAKSMLLTVKACLFSNASKYSSLGHSDSNFLRWWRYQTVNRFHVLSFDKVKLKSYKEKGEEHNQNSPLNSREDDEKSFWKNSKGKWH